MKWITIENDPEFGPMARLNWDKNKETVKVLLDTGSIYLLASNAQKICNTEDLPSEIQTYYYAGQEADFIWIRGNPNLISVSGKGKISLGCCLTAGYILPDSVASLGIPAVMGLCPIPKEYTQHYKIEGFINNIGINHFAFDLRQESNLKFGIGCSKHLGSIIAKIRINPMITQPTPGLGFMTNNIVKLLVRFGSTEYRITRTDAPSNLSQSYQYNYVITTNGITTSGLMNMINWYVLFDTRTLPGVFHADASTNLLSNRVTNSILPEEKDPNNYTQAELVQFTFDTSNIVTTISGSNILVPTITPDTFSDRFQIFTVFGFSMMLGNLIQFRVNKETGLPKSVVIRN
jgi:hypothetical protein